MLRKSLRECIIASIKCAQIQRRFLGGELGARSFSSMPAPPISSSRVAGHIQDDTDLNRTLKSRLITPLRFCGFQILERSARALTVTVEPELQNCKRRCGQAGGP